MSCSAGWMVDCRIDVSSDIEVESCPISVDSIDQNCSSETVLIGRQHVFNWTRRNRHLNARLSPCGGLCEAISRHLRQDLRLTGTSDLITLRDVHNFQNFFQNALLSITLLVEP